MKTHTTYEMLVQSEDKSRTVIETLIYAAFIVSAVVSIGLSAAQPVVVPEKLASHNVCTQTKAC
ncbi:MAG: hypothetical protein JO354_01855 [Verrucomicrobia bacterium]|nr:hypothetical protein [Verrucomicrobiota bacterium]